MNINQISGAELGAHIRSFFENDLVGFHIFGPDQIIADINDRELEMIGYDREELVGKKTWADLIVHEQRSRFDSHWRHILNGKRVHNLEYTLLHKSGSHVHVILNAVGVYESDGRLISTCGCVVDISQRKNIERALVHSEEKFRSMVETAQEGIWVLGLNGEIQYANRPMASMLGYSVQELTGKAVVSLLENEAQNSLPRHPEPSRSGIRERYLKHKNGAHVWVLESQSVLRDEFGNMTGILGMMTDRSALVLEENRQRLALEMLHLLNRADNPGDVISRMLDLIKEFGHFDVVSLRLKDTHLGEGGQDLYRLDLRIGSDCVCGDHICKEAPRFESLYSMHRSVWRTSSEIPGEPFSADWKIFGCCRTAGYESVALIPLRSVDSVIGFLQICDARAGLFSKEDIEFLEGIASSIGIALDRLNNQRLLHLRSEELERANGLLVQKNKSLDVANEKLRRANVAKSEFVSKASHELRTPLSTMIGFTQTLLARDLDFDIDSQRHFLQIIESEVRRLDKLLHDMLDLSKMEAGAVVMRTETFDLQKLLMETTDFLNAGSKVPITCSIASGERCLIRADKDRLKQVVINLITNAQRFTAGDKPVEVTWSVQGDCVRVSVRDHGPGISIEQQRRIFDRFYRGHNPANSQGSGLGLAIAQEIVQSFGGRIWVESTPGEGACFYFTVPKEETVPASQ